MLMIVAFSFVGILPKYIIESVHQARCFFSGDIYLITNDMSSIYITALEKYNVKLIDYEDVKSPLFIETVEKNYSKFVILKTLHGREEIFIRSFERFFLLRNLMKTHGLTECLFLELDNLIYDDPNKWVQSFSENQLCYMFDNYNRFSSGLMHVKNADSLDPFMELIIDRISNSNEFLTEMKSLSIYYENNVDKVQILPTIWKRDDMPEITYSNYEKYDSLFDALGMGVYLLGIDPHHMDGQIIRYLKAQWCFIDYTQFSFEWKTDEMGRRKPYIWNGEKHILINNLHVHSKDLESGLSLPMM